MPVLEVLSMLEGSHSPGETVDTPMLDPMLAHVRVTHATWVRTLDISS